MRLFKYNPFILRKSKKDIELICKRYNIRNYTINEDFSIDINGDVFLSNFDLVKIPLKFNKVSGYFNCHNNKLTSLEGCPRSVGGVLLCSDNQLSSLKGCPEYIGDGFYCNNNQLCSLEGFPEFFEGKIYILNNPVSEIIWLFPHEKFDRAVYWLNEFDVIRDGKQVILDRLEEVFAQMNLEIPENIKFKNYEII